jgi:hypothetical protein
MTSISIVVRSYVNLLTLPEQTVYSLWAGNVNTSRFVITAEKISLHIIGNIFYTGKLWENYNATHVRSSLPRKKNILNNIGNLFCTGQLQENYNTTRACSSLLPKRTYNITLNNIFYTGKQWETYYTTRACSSLPRKKHIV